MLGAIVRQALGRLRATGTPDQVRDLMQRGDWPGARAAAARLHPDTPARELTRLCLEAEIAFRAGDDAAAERGFRGVLAQDAAHPDAHHGLSLLLYEQGDAEAALRHAKFASEARPQDARLMAQLGLCHVRQGNFPLAERVLKVALRGLPQDKSCWNNMGIVQAAKGDRGQARRCFEKALELDPGFESARQNLALLGQEDNPPASDSGRSQATPGSAGRAGKAPPWKERWRAVLALHEAGRGEDALRAADAVAADWPGDSLLAVRIGRLHSAHGDPEGGIESMLAHLKDHPRDTAVLAEVGKSYATLSQPGKAEAFVRRAIECGDDSPATLAQLGEILHLREEFAQACEVTRQALDRSPERPVELVAQLAAAQVLACRYQEALAGYEELLARKGRLNDTALRGYVLCLAGLGRFDEAQALLDEQLRHAPNDAYLRTQRFQLRLMRGDWEGWDDYLYRGLSQGGSFRALPLPRWQGEPLAGKGIIVLAEQGLGDQVMLASCLPDLLALGPARVYVEATHRVAPALARSFPDCVVIATAQDAKLEWVKQAAGADCYVPLGDLPARFRRSLDAFPRRAYLRADPARVAHWKGRIAACGPGPWVGVSWRGGTQGTRQALRSFPPRLLRPLAAAATCINLQYGEVGADIEDAAAAGLRIHHFREAIDDLDEFAALIAALDAVVTACNTTVHFAGALGARVWVLAPQFPEWRYGLSFREMPWYPNVTVLRQPARGEWAPGIAAAAAELAHWRAAPASAHRGTGIAATDAF